MDSEAHTLWQSLGTHTQRNDVQQRRLQGESRVVYTVIQAGLGPFKAVVVLSNIMEQGIQTSINLCRNAKTSHHTRDVTGTIIIIVNPPPQWQCEFNLGLFWRYRYAWTLGRAVEVSRNPTA